MVRSKKSHPVILDAVIEGKGSDWNKSTQAVVRTDSQRILEAMVAEFGIAGATEALENHGFTAKSYLYLLKPLYGEAQKRRSIDGR